MQELWSAVIAAITGWHQGKLFVEHAVTIDHDSLHVIVGVLLWILIGLAVRRPLSSRGPWLWLFAIILWNETVDLWTEQWPDPGHQYGEGVKDVLVTMLLPTIFLVTIRVRPDLFRRGLGER